MAAAFAPIVAPGAAPVPVDVAANAAVRSLTDAERSRCARCKSALVDVRPATSARDFARSSRAMSQHAADEIAMAHPPAMPVAQRHVGRAARAAGGGPSTGGAGVESRTSLTMREAKLSRLATMKRRTSAVCLLIADSRRRTP